MERTWLTCRSTKTDSIEEIGIGMRNKLEKLAFTLKIIKSKIKKKKENSEEFFYNRKKRFRLEKVKRRQLEKIENIIENTHRTVSKNLCENNSLILVPKLNFHSLKKLKGISKRIYKPL